jgi:large subunit ribosomal protein L21
MATTHTGTDAQATTKAAPGPYAIIETGGKQYRVAVGDRLSIEKLPSDAGAEFTFERVLMVGGDGAPRVGTPVIAGASVSATIEEQYRGTKIVVFKYKPKKRYRRRTGHRQALTRVAITAINA